MIPACPRFPGCAAAASAPAPLRAFAYHIGVTKYDSVTDIAVLRARTSARTSTRSRMRRLAVLHPIKLVLTNIPAGETDESARQPTIRRTKIQRHGQSN
jgi:glutaminyl-tRNA synthetase